MNDATASNNREERITTILDDYLQALQAGKRPDKNEVLVRHADIAEELEDCLVSLEYVQGMRMPAAGEHHDRAHTAYGKSAGKSPPRDELASLTEPRVLGDFRIVREIGRGGMGVVYEAEQISLGRRVAVKVLPFAGVLDERQRQRFVNEAQTAALLHHQNIVPVYQVGSDRGVSYYAMQFVDGQTLGALIQQLRDIETARAANGHVDNQSTGGAAQDPTSHVVTSRLFGESSHGLVRRSTYFRKIAEIGIQAAVALGHAHEIGVIHRDVKPTNLMLDLHGKVWVTDFGLARMSSDVSLTMTGDVLGTVRYMSPEQALANRSAVDHRSDIYSLGATLFELLTLEPLVSGDNREELLRKISLEEARGARHINPRVPLDLETIVLKSVSKAPADRYASASELADDLRRFLEDKPVVARRPTVRQKTAKWIRRHRQAVITGSLVLLLAMLIALPLFIWNVMERETQAQMAAAEQASLRQQLQRQLYVAYISLADQAWSLEDNGPRTLRLLEQCRPAAGDEDLRGFEWFMLKHRCRDMELTPSREIGAAITSLSVSRDDKMYATTSSVQFSYTGSDVIVWDFATGDELFRLPETGHCVGFSPADDLLATGSGLETEAGFEQAVTLWRSATGEKTRTLRRPIRGFQPIRKLRFSPDGKWLVGIGNIATAALWNVATEECVVLDDVDGVIEDVAFSRDSRSLAAVSSSGAIGIWTAIDTARSFAAIESGSVENGQQAATAVAFSLDDTRLALGRADGPIEIFDIPTQMPTRELRGHKRRINSLTFLDEVRLASASDDKTVHIWNLETGESAERKGHEAGVQALAFARGRDRLISGSRDRRVRLWSAEPYRKLAQFQVDSLGFALQYLDFSPDSSTLAVADKKNWRFFKTSTGSELKREPNLSTWSVTYSPDGALIATTNFDPNNGADDTFSVKLIEAASGNTLSTIPGVSSPSFSPGGKQIVCGRQRISLWDVTDPTNPSLVRTLWDNARRGIARFIFDQNWIAGASPEESVLRVWPNSETRDEFQLETEYRLRCGSWSPDGKTLALGTVDCAIQIWDVTRREKIGSFEGHGDEVFALEYSPDGKTLASGSEDGTVKLWHVATGACLVTISTHASPLRAVRFSPDGQFLATASADGKVLLHHAPR